MGQPRAQMIAGAVQENLRLIFEPAKCTRVNDPGAITLELGPVAVALLGIFSAARVPRFLGERCERSALGRFHLVARSPTVFHLAIFPSSKLRASARWLLVDLTIQKTKGKYVQEISSKKAGHAGTFNGNEFRLWTTAGDWRSRRQQGFRFFGKRPEIRGAGKQRDRRIRAWFANNHERARRS